MKNARTIVELFANFPTSWSCDAVAIGIYADGSPQKALEGISAGWFAEVKQALSAGWMQGKEGEFLILPIPREPSGPARLLLIGLGKRDGITLRTLEDIGARLVKTSQAHGISRLGCLIPMNNHNGISKGRCIQALAEGAWRGGYRFDRFKSKNSENEQPPEKSIILGLAVKEKQKARMSDRLERLRHICDGQFLAQDLGNMPGNLLTPERLASEAREMAENLPIQVTVWNEKELKKNRMHGILAVGQGSAHPPRLIIMEYRQGGERPVLAVVGKAVTFDSGGISLKPGAKMEEMKFDMAGGAAVLGFMYAIASMNLPINVVGLIPAAENLPSGHAQRPGDVIEMASGQWVEVINTDAEGRLILADALHHAQSFEPNMVIDLATLTGACVIALGHEASGLMGFDAKFLRKLERAGNQVGEKMWRLPLFPGYQEQLKSTVADMKNVGGRDAGAITAGCFLSRFIDKKVPWAHVDIAGTAWDMGSKRPSQPKGATGVGVRFLCRFAQKELV